MINNTICTNVNVVRVTCYSALPNVQVCFIPIKQMWEVRFLFYANSYIAYVFIPTDAVAFGNAHFGAGSGTIHLHVVGCTGSETNLTDCPEVRSGIYCLQGHSEDAGVRCQGLIEIPQYKVHLCVVVMQIITLQQKLELLKNYDCIAFL